MEVPYQPLRDAWQWVCRFVRRRVLTEHEKTALRVIRECGELMEVPVDGGATLAYTDRNTPLGEPFPTVPNGAATDPVYRRALESLAKKGYVEIEHRVHPSGDRYRIFRVIR